ncbi:MAG TPA: 50S ribosomal protein L11 methyltransferase [Pyrinomonadaceae bacterium]
MKDQWYAVEITVDPSAVEAMEHLFNELGSLGTEVQQFYKAENEPLTVVGYFDEPPDEGVLDGNLSEALRIHGLNNGSIRSVERKTIEKTDWLAEWKKHWQPTRVGRFLIVPDWQDVPDIDGSIVIRIDPNMAFGTGTHETTQLCLKAIGKTLRPADSFLDVGTGTGILAIAAAKLFDTKKRRILALDNDPVAVEIARENAWRNGVGELIDLKCGEISEHTPPFDFVCANLTLDVIRPILPLLLQKAQRVLILSGILKEQETTLRDDLAHLGVATVTVGAAGDWISATIER